MDICLKCVDLVALLACDSINTVIPDSWKKRCRGLIILILERFGTKTDYACSRA